MSETNLPNIETVKTLQAAWQQGLLKYQRSLTYKKAPAALGSVFYLILYEQGGQVIYQGAYQLKLSLEEKLIKKDYLFTFLTLQLATQL
jgi:hypothetical protein